MTGPNIYTTIGPWAEIAPYFALGSGGVCYPASAGLRPGVGIIWGLLRGSPELVQDSIKAGQPWVYLDHGYFHRGHYGGHYRVTWCDFQQREYIERPFDRWLALRITLKPWRKGRDVVVCPPSDHVCKLFGLEGWEAETVERLKHLTDRPIKVHRKTDKQNFQAAINGAHCVVTTNSIAAVEAVTKGIPVFVDPTSAASPVGLTDLTNIEEPIYPDRDAWAASLAYGQFTRDEMRDGTCWKIINRQAA